MEQTAGNQNQSTFIEPAPRRTKQKVLAVSLVLVILVAIAASITLAVDALNSRVNRVEAIQNTQILITRKGFTPASVTITRGTRVTWTNTYKQPYHLMAQHPSDAFAPDEILEEGSSFSATFAQSGTYSYYDANNPTSPGGQVTVQ